MNQNYFIKTEEISGRGLYATNDMRSGMLLSTEELLVLSPEDTKTVSQTILNYYTFKFNDTNDCLVLGEGELYNHSPNPNIGYKLIDHDGRKVMAFFTLKEISRGEQLFIDYAADTEVDTSKYTVNMIG